MLKFDQEHKAADLSAIKSKTDKIKNVGKVMICGIALSSVLLLSGCGSLTNEMKGVEEGEPIATAIIITNDNALLVDLSDFSYGRFNIDVQDMDGDRLILGIDYTIVVDGENCHQRAEDMAESLVGDKGEVISYDGVNDKGKTI